MNRADNHNTSDRAPLTGHWWPWYVLVVGFLLLLILLFLHFTRTYA